MMKERIIYRLFLTLTLMFTPVLTYSQLSKVGTSAAEFLRIPVGARVLPSQHMLQTQMMELRWF